MPIIFYCLLALLTASTERFTLNSAKPTKRIPAQWPEQFHSLLVMNNSKGTLQIVDLWYDWPGGRNFNIIQNQLGKLVYNLEWDNGTSFYYTLDYNRECRVLHFPMGILRPDWLDGAKYLGQRFMDGFVCNVWETVEFIWYYEDILTKRPVYWAFFNGRVAHVITFEVGRVLEDSQWQAPEYCFKDSNEEMELSMSDKFPGSVPAGNLMRGFSI